MLANDVGSLAIADSRNLFAQSLPSAILSTQNLNIYLLVTLPCPWASMASAVGCPSLSRKPSKSGDVLFVLPAARLEHSEAMKQNRWFAADLIIVHWCNPSQRMETLANTKYHWISSSVGFFHNQRIASIFSRNRPSERSKNCVAFCGANLDITYS